MPTDNCKHPVNHDWKNYYIMLEAIRRSGICNMWGAHPYLAATAGISQKLAQEILMSWISNYDELRMTYWPNPDEHLWIQIKNITAEG